MVMNKNMNRKMKRFVRRNKALIMGVLFGAQFLLMGKGVTFQILHLLVVYAIIKIAFI